MRSIDRKPPRAGGPVPLPPRRTAACALACLCAAPGAAADEPKATLLPDTVVTASRVPVEAREVGSALSVITGQDIERRRLPLAAELLREVPGVSVNRAGQIGALTQVRIRGAEGNHTLVLIDGVEANDPVSSSEFNFAHLLSDDIERIEVLRGPQSALWGADSIGGVVNIVTRGGREGFAARGLGEAGSFSTTHVNLGASGGNGVVDFALSGSSFDTGGINASRFGTEEDGYDNRFVNGRFGLRPSKNLQITANARYQRNRSQFDQQDFAFPPTPTEGLAIDGDNLLDANQFYGGARARLSTFDGRWEHEVSAGYTWTENESYTDGVFQNVLEGRKYKLAYQGDVHIETPSLAGSRHTLTGYVEREREEFDNTQAFFAAANQSRSTTEEAIAGEWRVDALDQVSLSASARHDFNDLFKDSNTWRFTGAWLVPGRGTRLHASYGKGVANPNFFELFGFTPGSFAGNPNLRPETSKGFDIGVEQPLLGERVVVDVTYFRTNLESEITTLFVGGPVPFTVANLDGTSVRKGIEVSLAAEIATGLSAQASYTYLRATEPGGREEVRRPKHTASVNLNYALPRDRGNVNIGVDFNGAMQDLEFVSATPRDRVRLGSYALVNAAAVLRITRELSFVARVENAFDRDYEEQFSFRSPGIAAYAGLQFAFDRDD